MVYMSKQLLHVTVITQEKQLSSFVAHAVTAPTVQGEITILPGHIPLFAKLQTGELRYQTEAEKDSFVVSKGFIDVGPNNQIMIMVDSAVEARAISLQKAEQAVQAAHETMSKTVDERELMMAEASLKRALLEIKVAQRTKHSRI